MREEEYHRLAKRNNLDWPSRFMGGFCLLFALTMAVMTLKYMLIVNEQVRQEKEWRKQLLEKRKLKHSGKT